MVTVLYAGSISCARVCARAAAVRRLHGVRVCVSVWTSQLAPPREIVEITMFCPQIRIPKRALKSHRVTSYKSGGGGREFMLGHGADSLLSCSSTRTLAVTGCET